MNILALVVILTGIICTIVAAYMMSKGKKKSATDDKINDYKVAILFGILVIVFGLTLIW